MKKKMLQFVVIMVLAAFAAAFAPGALAAETAYWDVNFDDGAYTNNAGSGKPFGVTHNQAGTTVQFAEDPIRGSMAVRGAMPMNAAPSGANLCRFGMEGSNIAALGQGVTWYEVSFMFEEAITPWNMLLGSGLFSVETDGTLYVGGFKGNSAFPGQLATNITIGLNEWYHLVIATDFVDRIGNSPKFYAWVNGEMITTAESAAENFTRPWNHAPGQVTAATNALRLAFSPNREENSVFWIDNLKMYQTEAPVRDTQGSLCFDPMAIFDGAEITSDSLLVEDGVIYAPAEETLGGVSALISVGADGAGYFDGAAAVADDEQTVTPAVGKSVYARSTGGIGVKKYSIEEGARLFDYDPSSAVWQKKGASDAEFAAVNGVSGLTAGDEVTLTLDFINDTPEEKSGVLVLAAYDGTALAGCSFTNISIQPDGASVTSAPLAVPDAETLSVTAYIWRGAQDFTPAMTRLMMAQ